MGGKNTSLYLYPEDQELQPRQRNFFHTMFTLFQAMLQSPKSLPHDGIREGWLGTFIPNGSNEPVSPQRIYSDFTGSTVDTSFNSPRCSPSYWQGSGKAGRESIISLCPQSVRLALQSSWIPHEEHKATSPSGNGNNTKYQYLMTATQEIALPSDHMKWDFPYGTVSEMTEKIQDSEYCNNSEKDQVSIENSSLYQQQKRQQMKRKMQLLDPSQRRQVPKQTTR